MISMALPNGPRNPPSGFGAGGATGSRMFGCTAAAIAAKLIGGAEFDAAPPRRTPSLEMAATNSERDRGAIR